MLIGVTMHLANCDQNPIFTTYVSDKRLENGVCGLAVGGRGGGGVDVVQRREVIGEGASGRQEDCSTCIEHMRFMVDLLRDN